MLQRVKAVVGQFGGVRMAENAEDAAIMFGIMPASIAHGARDGIPPQVMQVAQFAS